MRDTAKVGAMKIHRFFGCAKNVLLPSGRNIFFQHIDEHVRMFHIGFAVSGKVGHLLVAKLEIALPDLVEPGAVAAAEVSLSVRGLRGMDVV